MSVKASKTQAQMATSASQERGDMTSQFQGIFTEQNTTIESLTAKVDDLTQKVQETAQLKTEITALQSKLSAAEQQAQRLQDEYNLAVRVKVIEATFPTGTAKH